MSNEPERIAKYLARAGVASRREVERMIERGQVKLNGVMLETPAVKVSDADTILVRGEPVGARVPAKVWLYNKPKGLVTTERDEKGRRTVFESLPHDLGRVLSIGRLDINSEGLLLLTNDGAVKRALELPSTGWLRRYRVRINGTPHESFLTPLREGITIDRENFQPMNVDIDRQQGSNSWLTVGIREGKNREIRRAFEAIGFPVNRLIRVSYGPFQLGDLEPNAVQPVHTRVLREQLPNEYKSLLGTPDQIAAPEKTKPKLKPRNKSRSVKPSRNS
jgi:23S rRNA pseudouridine2605 synthase